VTDVWSDWLLHRRHADDPAYERVVRGVVEGLADRVLDDANLSPGMILADIGAGEGLLAFRAIERVGPTLQVVLTDISGAMLYYVVGCVCGEFAPSLGTVAQSHPRGTVHSGRKAVL
jgi:arsenite methyltransferase